MSNHAFSNIKQVSEIEFKTFLHGLVRAGWTFNDCGGTTYLPVGDSDFSWTGSPLKDESAIFDLFQQKIDHKEIFGVVISFKDTNSGGSLCYSADEKTISFSWLLNRNEVHPGKLDFDWYIERIKPVLQECMSDKKLLSSESDSSGGMLAKREDKLLAQDLDETSRNK